MIVSAIVFALLLGIFIFWVLPRGSLLRRTASVSIFIALIAVVFAGAIEMMSRPKEARLEWRGFGQAKLLAASLQEGQAIYVWLQIDGSPEPRAYALPWSMEEAQQLQDALSEAQSNGTGVMVTKPFESSMDTGEPKFYAMPQPALPPKQTSGDGPLVYSQPDNQL